MNVTCPVEVTTAEWAAYLQLQVAKEMESGVLAAEDRFFRVCGSFERGMRVKSTIARQVARNAERPSVLTVLNPDEFFGRSAPAVLCQRSSRARRAGRTAATARHDRWQLGTLTLVTVTVCLYLLIETLRGVA